MLTQNKKNHSSDNNNSHKKDKQTMIYKALHRKLKIDQHEPNTKSGVTSGAPERQAVLAPPVTPIVLL
jgi:hypothetical protein